MGSTVELTYAMGKGTKCDHMQGFVGGQYQKGFDGKLHNLHPESTTACPQWPILTMCFLPTSNSIAMKEKQPTTGQEENTLLRHR